MPTLLSLAGVESGPFELDGVDFSPVCLQGETLEPRALYWAALSNGGRRSEAMRQGDWKLVVQHPDSKPGSFENPVVELFHLGRDLGEAKNLIATEQERAEAMHAQLRAWYASVTEGATMQPGGWP